MQANISPVSDLRPGRIDYTIHVRISRMWEFRGPNEENDLRHLDLILIDQKGDPIYAEIPPDAVLDLKSFLEEGKIIIMSKITVERKPGYRAVENHYMIKLNTRTCIFPFAETINFPKYTFSLTPFEILPRYIRRTDRFLDVIGKITGVSNAVKVYNTSGDPMMRRVIRLQDLMGNVIELSLSGKRATEFPAEAVLDVGQKHHVIAIFVGTLMKLYRDEHRFLSGTSACRWYVNENDIPAIKTFQKNLPNEATAVENIYLQSDDEMQQNFEQANLLQLQKVDPFIHKLLNFRVHNALQQHSQSRSLVGLRYQCTVTIVGIAEKQTWCYRACKVCNSSHILIGNTYQCTREGCPCTQFLWKYKIPFIATDGTYSLEFIFFEKKGVELIGKTAETLHKQYDPNQIPPQISELIGQKFSLVVIVSTKRSINRKDPSFEVLMIKERFGKQPIIPVFRPEITIAPDSESTTISHEKDLPALIAIPSKKSNAQTSTSTNHLASFEDMDIEPSGIWDESQSSTKRNLKETDNDNQDPDETK
ncbi:hypothetical protein U9M48_026744 [Paspalum notatum var. saurae]|uniref:Replication protein A 70 kDa DNA-binding subunit B/D first OB fold domain-containing protein n=1 Tax=Paspalum notatum var. saurae TaxID=547442 RepID=A0AAQ3TT94_PASNO